MSIKDLVTGLEERVDHLFTHAEQPDPATLRAPVLDAIRHAEQQWASRSSGVQPDWFSESNGTVALTPVLANGTPLTIGGLTTTFVPADRFPEYLANMRGAVETGVFDAEIQGGVSGSPNVSGVATVPMPGANDTHASSQPTGTLHGADRRPDDRVR